VWIPAAIPSTSAPNAPPGNAGCAASTASSWAWNTSREEELPSVDLDCAVEAKIQEIKRSLPETSPSAQMNINVAPESSGGEPVNKDGAEGASSGTESCRNSSQEPEELGKERAHIGLERCETAALSLPLTGREIRRVEFLSAGLVLLCAFSSNSALTQHPQALPSRLLQR
ncbi:hypothetical protein Nmel_001612, partial [Mimus melanotis]